MNGLHRAQRMPVFLKDEPIKKISASSAKRRRKNALSRLRQKLHNKAAGAHRFGDVETVTSSVISRELPITGSSGKNEEFFDDLAVANDKSWNTSDGGWNTEAEDWNLRSPLFSDSSINEIKKEKPPLTPKRPRLPERPRTPEKRPNIDAGPRGSSETKEDIKVKIEAVKETEKDEAKSPAKKPKKSKKKDIDGRAPIIIIQQKKQKIKRDDEFLKHKECEQPSLVTKDQVGVMEQMQKHVAKSPAKNKSNKNKIIGSQSKNTLVKNKRKQRGFSKIEQYEPCQNILQRRYNWNIRRKQEGLRRKKNINEVKSEKLTEPRVTRSKANKQLFKEEDN